MGKGRAGLRAGFTMIEVVVALAVLTIAIGAVSSTFATTKTLSRANRERALAVEAIEGVIEAMRSLDPAEVFVRYNATNLDDPVGEWCPGPLFAIAGLEPRPNDPDGFVGGILFPGDNVELREDVVDPELGMDRDLNGDGVIDGNDHAADYSILPVRVQAEWLGTAGVQSMDVVYVISGR